MSASRKQLLVAGLALAIAGMVYGLWYALFAEHQELDRMGASLAAAFAHAAERKMPEASEALQAYARTEFNYVRHVDVHSHWGGLAMLLIVLGAVFDRVGFDERKRFWLATMLVAGGVGFPLGVLLQTLNPGPVPRVTAAVGSAFVILGLGVAAVGFARGKRRL